MALSILKNLLKLAPTGVEFASIRSVSERTYVLVARDGRPEHVETNQDQGYMVEVMQAGHLAYAATSSSVLASIQSAFAQAKATAERAHSHQIHRFKPERIRLPEKGTHLPSTQGRPEQADLHLMLEQLVQANGQLKASDKIINTNCTLSIIEREVHYLSTLGAEISQVFHYLALEGVAMAQAGAISQKRSGGMGVRQGDWRKIDWPQFQKDCRRIGEEALELLAADPCPSATMDLLLDPDQLYLQIHESIGHPLELDRILGDERNYAGWSFIKAEDFGHLTYGSPLLNVTFNPQLEGELASYAFDDTGQRAQREYLIKEGKLLRSLGGAESQERSQVLGVSNMRSTSWNRPPIDRMANINLEPGHSSLQQMIEKVERGIYMKTNRSWSIDDYRNKFQFGCEYGRLIENGQLTKTVRNPNYRGTTLDFWGKLRAVGDKSTYQLSGSMYCGKGEPNQIIRVGHACPTSLFSGIEVFGGVA